MTTTMNATKMEILYSSYGERGYVRVSLDSTWVAHFHPCGENGIIRIISVSGTEIGVYQLPTHRMMTALAFAIANPSVFRDALDAFATKVG